MSKPIHRRAALGLIGSAPLTSVDAAPEQTPPEDQPRDLQPTGADIGSLFPDIERLVSRGQYPYSFLAGRFRSPEEYSKAGRELVLDAAHKQHPGFESISYVHR